MSLLLHEQFLSHIKRAERPLIVLRDVPHVDDFATALGLVRVLASLGKQTEIFCAGTPLPTSLTFLANGIAVKSDLPNIRSIAITIDLARAKVDTLTHVTENDTLRISVTPQHGAWNGDDVRVSTTNYRYDVVIMIGVPDIIALGEAATAYADFFFNTPIVNIDHAGANEHFGHCNLVDVSAVANGEACADVIARIDDTLIDADVATCFLAGIIAKTKSFKTPNVTPKTLKAAGTLMNKGARRDEIVEHLYRTRSVATLRLWGRALARLKTDNNIRLAWTLLTKQDFVAAGTNEHALDDIVEELLTTTPDADVVAILYEHTDGHIAVRLHTARPHDALALGAPFKASGTREAARLSLATADIVEAEKLVVTHLQQALAT